MTETEGPSLIFNTARKTFVSRHDTRAQRKVKAAAPKPAAKAGKINFK
jgi:hypothetical protein